MPSPLLMTYQLLRPLYGDWGMGHEGQVVPIDPEQAEVLESRGLVARVKQVVVPENKMLPAPTNKMAVVGEVKQKPKRRVTFGTPQ